MAEGRDNKKKLERLSVMTSDLHPTDELTDSTMEVVQVAELGRIGRETELVGLGSSDALTAAILASVEAARDPLDGFAARTSGLQVQDGFTDSVMSAVTAYRGSVFPEGMMRTARPSLLFAAVAAAACVLLSWYTQQSVEQDAISNADVFEVME